MKIIFVTGGARSGKSTFALEQAKAANEPVTFIATAQPFDAEMTERIKRHQLERRNVENPDEWATIEAPTDIKTALEQAKTKVVILDCLSLLVSNLMLENYSEKEILERIGKMLEAAKTRDGMLVVVSNEVGSGVVPEYPLGRLFRDVLGRSNQMVAAASSEAYLLVAGLALQLK
jgi:adenosylcobinamide kinase / adenosylcobinamide-phosphate guanylyltransferase